jgi:hypothetical protein
MLSEAKHTAPPVGAGVSITPKEILQSQRTLLQDDMLWDFKQALLPVGMSIQIPFLKFMSYF